MVTEMDDRVLRDIYAWVDAIPLSRPKRNISRDFSDGVLMAEIVKFYYPKYIDLHNFPGCYKADAKRANWNLLNWKVFAKFNFKLTDDVIEALVTARPGTIEKLILLLRAKFSAHAVDGHASEISSRLPQIRGRNAQCATSPPQPPLFNPLDAKENIPDGRLPATKKLAILNYHGNRTNEQTLNAANAKHWGRFGQMCSINEITSQNRAYDLKVQECLDLQETVHILTTKLRRMTHLLELKDIRITELQSRIEFLLKS